MTLSAVRSASFSSGSAGLLTESLVWMIGSDLALRCTGPKKPALPVALKKLPFPLPARVTDAECAFFVVFAALRIALTPFHPHHAGHPGQLDHRDAPRQLVEQDVGGPPFDPQQPPIVDIGRE